MKDDRLQPITSDQEIVTTECHTLLLEAVLTATGSLSVRLAGSMTVLPDSYGFLTGDCTQVAVKVQFPCVGGSLTVSTSTSDTAVYPDSDGDCSITFYRSSPDEFDVDFSIPAPKPTTLVPRPGVPSKRVKLVPKIGYPPPDSGDK
jgi:hypothetical protein